MAEVTNITKSEGGAGEETEENFRERIFLAPSSYSTAGPSDAYEYWVKQYNSAAIEDVKIYEPEDAVVDIRILLNGGELPTQTFCNGCLAYLKNNPIIPLTDKDQIAPPDVVKYDIKATYYIGRSDINNLAAIKSAIEAAKIHISSGKNKDRPGHQPGHPDRICQSRRRKARRYRIPGVPGCPGNIRRPGKNDRIRLRGR